MRIAFVWQGIRDPKIVHGWQDGLRLAVEKISQGFDVKFYEPSEDIVADIILYWEAPITIQHPINGVYYNKVRFNDGKKILLFAGGQIKKEWVDGFDLLLVESKINEQECENLGIPYLHAFGINDRDFRPIKQEKVYDGMLHGTCATYKRQWLIGEALGEKGMVCGRYQEHDAEPFDRCKKYGCKVMPEMLPDILVYEINSSHTLIQTSDMWGGGQRATLEAMACGIPPIVMSDSPKNMQFVEDSGFGLVVEPTAEAIKRGVQQLKDNPPSIDKGIDYVNRNYTSEIYKNQILKAINKVLHD